MYDIQDLYQEIIMDHNSRPRNFRVIEDHTSKVDGFNPLCGDQVTVYLQIESGIVVDVSFEGVGGAISKSSASMMTESVKGKNLDEAKILFETFREMITRKPDEIHEDDTLGDLLTLQGVTRFPARIKCATLSWHALQAALQGGVSKVSTE